MITKIRGLRRCGHNQNSGETSISPKKGYFTNLGAPILINSTIFQRKNELDSLKQLNLQFDDIKISIL